MTKSTKTTASAASTAKGPDPQKLNALKQAMTQIDRQFGKGAVMRLGEKTIEKVEVISTGSFKLDKALGVGGLPKGRVVEIYGPESSGKTTIALEATADCQKNGGIVAYVDTEHALDPSYAKSLGVDLENLILSQPDTAEQALEIINMLVDSGSIDLIVLDSVAALVPKAEIEGEMGELQVGLQARLMSQAMRKLAGTLKRTNTCAVFINQLRMKIGAMMPGQSPETTTGGNALKFYASIRLDIRRIGSVKKGDDIVGNNVKIKVVKNKLAPPFKQVETEIIFGQGFSAEGEMIDLAVDAKVIDKSGAWFAYKGKNFAQGREQAREYLKDNPEIAKEIKEALAGVEVDEFKPSLEDDV